MKKANIIIRDLKHLKGKTYFGGAYAVDRNEKKCNGYIIDTEFTKLAYKQYVTKKLHFLQHIAQLSRIYSMLFVFSL